jgi:uncharacterized protein YaiI (UPF0178 family)
VNHAEPLAAMNDKGKLVTASGITSQLVFRCFHNQKKKAIPHLKGIAVFPGESKRFYSRPAKHLELLKRSC